MVRWRGVVRSILTGPARAAEMSPITAIWDGHPNGFLKSRVYAKLLVRLISECYQTFNGQPAEVQPDAHDIPAHEIGKWMNGYANFRGRVPNGQRDLPAEEANGLRIRHGSSDHG